MSEPIQHKGYITSFDLIKNTGVIFAASDKSEYSFSSKIMSDNIPELQNHPAIFFTLSGNEVTSVRYDPDTMRPKPPARKGLAILGAAKCPNCTWRLPILPDNQIPKVRKGENFNCPDCDSPLKLNSAFIGFHHYASVGILVVPFILRRILLRSSELFSEDSFETLNMLSLWFIPIQILLFFYLYYQENLVVNEEAEAFR